MAPNFDELLIRTPLPATAAEVYTKGSVQKDISTCGSDDKKKVRVMVDPTNSTAYFPKFGDVSPKTTFLNIDDGAYQRILTATGGFLHERPAKTPGMPPLGPGVAHLCRSQAAIQGRYELYISENSIVENNPAAGAALRRVDFDFTFDEIRIITGSNILTRDHWRITPTNHQRLELMPDDTEINNLIGFVEKSDSPIAPERRGPIVAALRNFLRDAQHQGLDMQSQAIKSQENMKWEMRVMQGLMMYMMAKQAGYTDRFDSIVSNTTGALWHTPVNLWNRDIDAIKNEWLDIFRTKNTVVSDLTDKLKKLNVPITEGAQDILDAFDRGEMPNAIYGGPSGGGKGFDSESAMAAALQGRSDVEAFEGKNLRAYRISIGAIVEKAGSWLNGGEKEFLKALKEVPNGSILQITEADQLAECGMGSGNEKLNLLPRLYNIMEQRPEVFMILESTRWQTIEAKGPDLLRRTGFAEITPPTPQKLRGVLEVGINQRKSGNKGKVLERRYSTYTFTPDALDAITALGAYERGAPPSAHLMVMDTAIAAFNKAYRQDNSIGTQITAEHIVQFVARKTSKSPDTVRNDLRTLLQGGIQNNPRVQAKIVESFYAAYKDPRAGFLNPVSPNPNPVVLEIDGKTIELRLGAYASAQEAIDASKNPAATTPPAATATGVPAPAPAPTPTTAPNPMLEVATYPINLATIEAGLQNADPTLVDFWKNQVVNGTSQPATVGELLQKLHHLDVTALRSAGDSLTMQGMPVHENPERLIFETLIRVASSKGEWSPSNPIDLPVRATHFATEVRTNRGVEKRSVDPAQRAAEEARRQAQEAARRTRGGRP